MENDYKELINNAAQNEFLDQSDLDLLQIKVQKPLSIITKDIISRRILLYLANIAGQQLN